MEQIWGHTHTMSEIRTHDLNDSTTEN